MAYALSKRLLRAVKASGLPYTEVAGWRSRGRGTMRSIKTITIHHTATPRSFRRSSDYPTLNVVKNGRSDLPGPLAQLGLGRSGRVYIIAAGISNHAGRSRATSMTNPHAIGIEAEGAMERWPAKQYDAYVRLVAALLDEFNLSTSRALRHAETCSPPGRKNDASFSGSAFRSAVAKVKPGTKAPAPKPKEDTMKRLSAATRTKDLAIAAGKTRRVHARENGTIRLANVKKGQAIIGTVWGDISGLLLGERALVRPVLAYYNSKKKVTTIKHRYPSLDVVGVANGATVRFAYPLTDGSVGYGGGGDEQATLQFEIVAPKSRRIVNTYLRHDILGS